jgi:hypothetical protein
MADGLFDPSRLYEALKQYGLLPKHGNFYPAGEAMGLFSPEINRLVAPDARLVGENKRVIDSTMGTLAHEMTHAVQNNLLRNTAYTLQQKKQQGKELTEQENQYLRAAEQIFVDQFGNIGNFNSAKDRQDRESYRNMTKDMYVSETGNKDFDIYRKSPTEAQAFGVGNMSFPSNLRRTGVNPHFDPSMTTEFDILLSMFEKLPESVKKSAAMEKQTKIEKNRQGSNDVYLNFSKDMFQNPFESTVK